MNSPSQPAVLVAQPLPPHMARWMEEYLGVLITAPILISIVPLPAPFHNPVRDAMVALSQAPEWYVNAVFTVLAATYGLQIIRGVRLPLIPWPRPSTSIPN